MNTPTRMLFGAIVSCVSLVGAAAEVEGARLARIHNGLTRAEVRTLAGRPALTSGPDRRGETTWTYDYTDEWGYESAFDIQFDAQGRVADTFAERRAD